MDPYQDATRLYNRDAGFHSNGRYRNATGNSSTIGHVYNGPNRPISPPIRGFREGGSQNQFDHRMPEFPDRDFFAPELDYPDRGCFGHQPDFLSRDSFGLRPNSPNREFFGPDPDFPARERFGCGQDYSARERFDPLNYPAIDRLGPEQDYPAGERFKPVDYPARERFEPVDYPAMERFGPGLDYPARERFGPGRDYPARERFGPGQNHPMREQYGNDQSHIGQDRGGFGQWRGNAFTKDSKARTETFNKSKDQPRPSEKFSKVQTEAPCSDDKRGDQGPRDNKLTSCDEATNSSSVELIAVEEPITVKKEIMKDTEVGEKDKKSPESSSQIQRDNSFGTADAAVLKSPKIEPVDPDIEETAAIELVVEDDKDKKENGDDDDDDADDVTKAINKLPMQHFRGVMSTLIGIAGTEIQNRKPEPLPPLCPIKLDDDVPRLPPVIHIDESTYLEHGITSSMLEEANMEMEERDLMPDDIGRGSDQSSFYCKLCEKQTTSLGNFRDHLNGRGHKAMLEAAKHGKRVPKSKKKTAKLMSEIGKKSVCLEIVKDVTAPILGLSFVTEYQSAVGVVCVCNLCAVKFDRNIIVSHATGNKHRLQYMKEKKPIIYAHLKKFGGKKSQLSASLDEICADCEQEDGRGQPVIRIYDLEKKSVDGSEFESTYRDKKDSEDNSEQVAMDFQDWVADEVNRSKEMWTIKKEARKQAEFSRGIRDRDRSLEPLMIRRSVSPIDGHESREYAFGKCPSPLLHGHDPHRSHPTGHNSDPRYPSVRPPKPLMEPIYRMPSRLDTDPLKRYTNLDPDPVRRLQRREPDLDSDALRRLQRQEPDLDPDARRRLQRREPDLDLDSLRRLKRLEPNLDPDPVRRLQRREPDFDPDALRRLQRWEPDLDPDSLRRLKRPTSNLDPDPVRRLEKVGSRYDVGLPKRPQPEHEERTPVLIDYAHSSPITHAAAANPVKPSKDSKTKKWESDIVEILKYGRKEARLDSLALIGSSYSSPECSPPSQAQKKKGTLIRELPFSRSYLETETRKQLGSEKYHREGKDTMDLRQRSVTQPSSSSSRSEAPSKYIKNTYGESEFTSKVSRGRNVRSPDYSKQPVRSSDKSRYASRSPPPSILKKRKHLSTGSDYPILISPKQRRLKSPASPRNERNSRSPERDSNKHHAMHMREETQQPDMEPDMDSEAERIANLLLQISSSLTGKEDPQTALKALFSNSDLTSALLATKHKSAKVKASSSAMDQSHSGRHTGGHDRSPEVSAKHRERYTRSPEYSYDREEFVSPKPEKRERYDYDPKLKRPPSNREKITFTVASKPRTYGKEFSTFPIDLTSDSDS